MTTEYTPTSWIARPEDRKLPEGWHIVRNSANDYVGRFPKAEALQIIRAVNAHDALVEALERLRACPDVNEDMLSPETIKACDDADDALRLARGEK